MSFLDKAKNAARNLDKDKLHEAVDKMQDKIGNEQINKKIDGVQEKLGHSGNRDAQSRDQQDPQRGGGVGGAHSPKDDRADDPESG